LGQVDAVDLSARATHLRNEKLTEHNSDYQRWIRDHDTFAEADWRAMRSHLESFGHLPLISVVMPTYNTRENFLREAIDSVIAQIYPHWELCIADDASTIPSVTRILEEYASNDPRIKLVLRENNGQIAAATNSALDLATGEFVAFLDHDDVLRRHALYEVAVEINTHPSADLIYSDEDHISETGDRFAPYFKPAWSEELLLGQNMVCHLAVYRRSLIERVGRLRIGLEGSQDHDLALRVSAATVPGNIRHIPSILYHWRSTGGGRSFSETAFERCVEAGHRAVADHMRALGFNGALVEPAPLASEFGWMRVVLPMPKPEPLVSVIVPTRDRPELLARCVDGLLNRTDYERIELLIVDNDSVELPTRSLLDELHAQGRATILPYAGPFNYSAINNMAARAAHGDVLLLLNNDIDVIRPDWLREMVSHAIRPEVGVVGAKLLYPDGRVQHGGVALAPDGTISHMQRLADRNDVGYGGQLALTRCLSAVTGACMAIRREVYFEIGGLDAVNLPIAFNDIDLCLRAGDYGYRVVWTPYACLFHRESASRDRDDAPEKVARFHRELSYMRRRWESLFAHDPFHNPNLFFGWSEFTCPSPPRCEKSWRAHMP
jgi:glycosyltransferase involved in cell wall biosynthesis